MLSSVSHFLTDTLNVVMPNVIMLSVVMLNIVMLTVVTPFERMAKYLLCNKLTCLSLAVTFTIALCNPLGHNAIEWITIVNWFMIQAPLSKKGVSMRLCHPPDGSTSPKYKLPCFITTKCFCKEKNALAFNRDRCCHLVLCLQLIPFHLE